MSLPGFCPMAPVLMKAPPIGPSHNASKLPGCQAARPLSRMAKQFRPDTSVARAAYARVNGPLSQQLSNYG